MCLVENGGPADRRIRVSADRGEVSGCKRLAFVIHPTNREVILFGEVLINPSEVCVIECRCSDIGNEVVHLARPLCVWRREELYDGFGNRIRHGGALRVGWDPRRTYLRSHLTEPFPRSEEKCLVLHNRPADRCAVLIAVKR